MSFHAELEGKTVQVDVRKIKSVYHLKIDKYPNSIICERQNNLIIVKLKNKSYRIYAFPHKEHIEAIINGKQVACSIQNSKALKSLSKGNHAIEQNQVRSNMPGKILKILVKKGATVKRDQPLLIMEAMKMENELKSPREGIIEEILVKEQDSVEANILLIKFQV